MQINGEALKIIRERSGHSQLSLAGESGVTQGRISEIEAMGSRAMVRPSTAQKLALALAVPLTALVVPEAAVA